MAMLAIEILNFLLGIAIFATGYLVSLRAFNDEKASGIKQEDLKKLVESVKWIGISFLFLALHEFTNIVTELNVLPFSIIVAYIITEVLFVGSIIYSAYQFREILYLVLKPESAK